jgi:hypothetical protein
MIKSKVISLVLSVAFVSIAFVQVDVVFQAILYKLAILYFTLSKVVRHCTHF